MAGWRVGLAVKPERQFGVVDDNESWHYIGPALTFNFKENNNWRFQNGVGSKVPEIAYEGRFSGTFDGSTYLDYNNFYWLLFGLEDYSYEDDTVTPTGGQAVNVGKHTFRVSNSKALKSFSLRILKLDRVVGGPSGDEEIVLKGCVMASFSPSYESGGSAIKVTFNGVYVDTGLELKNLNDTDYDNLKPDNLRQIDWGCLQVRNADDTAWEPIANNEKTGFTISRSVTTVPSCGMRIDSAFYEQAVSVINVSSTVYSRNPNQWQTRMHTGGKRNDITVGQTSSPRTKGLEPIPDMRIASQTSDGIYSCYVTFKDVAVDSWGNSYNTNSEIVESPTLKAMEAEITIITKDVTEAIWTEPAQSESTPIESTEPTE